MLILKDRFPSTIASLVEKLGEANWHRRERLRKKVASASVIADHLSNGDGISSVSKTVTNHSQYQSFLNQSSQKSVIELSMSHSSIHQSNTTLSQSAHSSIFDQDTIQFPEARRTRSIAQSVTSFATSIADWPENGQHRVPKLPNGHDFKGSFQCKICGDVQRDIRNRADWK